MESRLITYIPRTALLLWIACMSMFAFGQGMPLTNKAAVLCQEKRFSEAIATIDQALADKVEKEDPYTWYVKGFIYKELYKDPNFAKNASTNRDVAVRAFQQSLKMDVKGQHVEMTKAGLDFLATTYLNEAFRRTREMDKSSELEPEAIYVKYKEIISAIKPGSSFDQTDIEMWKSLAQRHYQLWQLAQEEPYHADRCAFYYNKVLEKDANNCVANFNLSILIYNRGVIKIRSIDYNSDVVELIMIQDECVMLFKQALPHAQKSFDACQHKKYEHYKTLMFINRALGREEEFNRLMQESEQLIQSGKLKK